ncbi:MAG: tryptophan--tRNA ligase [Candidatus Yonathbacteria bacterium]|nr:tryptophan--tRNA ligase [Candidatus Yonathbacteria bacterium]NTW47870.1 tryptophan--tRNA ligase [Candidatus Yonathbacteria bacterium]
MSSETKPIGLSGVKPTGRPHIGNYFGAMRQFVALQEEYRMFVFIADLHGLNLIQDASMMRELSLGVAIDYLALGLDPSKTVLYRQSDIPEITELSWILGTLTTMPYLMRAHAFKDAEAKNKDINVGTFTYPVLMAADILIQDAQVVPVGKDQEQHLEIARDMAAKFNTTFGETFIAPKSVIMEDVATVPGIDGRKMSKSYDNTIPLFGSDDEIVKAVAGIVTDSRLPEEPKNPDADNIFALHKLFSTSVLPDIERRYREGGMGYKESKDILREHILDFVRPLREKREAILGDVSTVERILDEGGKVARERAIIKLDDVRKKTGLR